MAELLKISPSTKYKRTKKGLAANIYSAQRKKSRENGFDMPSYTLEEFKIWLFAQPRFELLYSNWVASDYNKMVSPSGDRDDDYKGYSLERLTLMTWQENKDKYHRDAINGINNKQNSAVIRTHQFNGEETEYYSHAEASRQTGISRKCITSVCVGRAKTAGGFYWRYKNK